MKAREQFRQPLQNDDINKALTNNGWYIGASEGRLMLAELLLKANAGFYNSHTEEGFMKAFGMLKRDRKLNKKGSLFLMDMFYASSNKKPPAFHLMASYRSHPELLSQ
tara:strand:+ start:4368 stop:4691 length:324 start_codon:yes stop_codon:yes gene_type:complete